MRIFLATNSLKIAKVFQTDKYEISGVARDAEGLVSQEDKLRSSDTLVVTRDIGIPEDMTLSSVICQVHEAIPELRILLLSGTTDFSNPRVVEDYANMVRAGIYDIYCEPRISAKIIYTLLERPMQKRDVDYILEYAAALSNNAMPKESSETDVVFSSERNNIIVFSSAKPGSGKSFVSTNTAAMIARYGHPKKNYEPPKILLLEGDLQTLSLETLLGVTNLQYNIKTALRKVRSIISDSGELTGTAEQQEMVTDFIRQCCLPVTTDIPNLFAIVGSSFESQELECVSPYHFFYLLNVVSEMFDIVIVDSNSALEHRTTGPIMQLAKQVFMVVGCDYDGVRIASRYNKELGALGIAGKVSYVLNKYVTAEQSVGRHEKMDFNPEDYFDKAMITAKIPYVDQIVQYNHIYQGKPIVLDDTYVSLPARIAFTKLANTIWPTDNYAALQSEVERLENDTLGKKAADKRRAARA